MSRELRRMGRICNVSGESLTARGRDLGGFVKKQEGWGVRDSKDEMTGRRWRSETDITPAASRTLVQGTGIPSFSHALSSPLHC